MAPECLNIPESTAGFKVYAADGGAIVVRRHGNPDGPRLILSHGNGLAIDAYYPFWSLLANRFDLFIYDIRNHGWNPVGERRMHNIPTFICDAGSILRDIDWRFGKKRNIGVFHSLASVIALHQADDEGRFSALVLFDLPILPPGGSPEHIQKIGYTMAEIARNRQKQFKTKEEFVRRLSGNMVFERVSPGVLDLFVRATLRRIPDGAAWELCCPSEYEAQIFDNISAWTITVDLGSIACPVKVIGADPTLPYSFMPSMDMKELLSVDYDFVPETTHLLQLEEPETCASLVIEFLENQGLV